MERERQEKIPRPPQSSKSTDLVPTPSGKLAKKFCYWFNNDYVKQIVNNNGSNNHIIRVVELFAGVGGFRIGLEGASDAYETIWNNQWEPSTKHQDASLVYQARFGKEGHSNQDINLVKTSDIPNHDLLVGGFPCQDYSVAASLSRSGGIEGKRGCYGGRFTVFYRKKVKQGLIIYFLRTSTAY